MPLTQSDRLKGAKNSLTTRRKKQRERRDKARILYYTGMRKGKIADALGVNYRTIANDLKVMEIGQGNDGSND